jgi:hypothetical protein
MKNGKVITGLGIEIYPEVIGGEYTLNQAKSMFTDGWRLPTAREAKAIFLLFAAGTRPSEDIALASEYWTSTPKDDTYTYSISLGYDLRSHLIEYTNFRKLLILPVRDINPDI